jgi:ActR/RegA family two-component response regulator
MNETRTRLLIVEDDLALQKQMCWAFDQYETIVAGDRESAMAMVRRHEPAIVTMDLGLPPHADDPTEGLQLLEDLHGLVPDTKVIVLTGQNDRANALKAIALGAYDFCEKPFEPVVLTLMIERAFRVYALQEENRRLQAQQHAPAMSGIVTRDPGMQKICAHGGESRPDLGHLADPRRVRHRQGAARPRVARALAAAWKPVRRPQLCGDTRNAPRKRTVRIREGRLHRGGETDSWQDRDSAWRNALPRRDR